MWIQLAIALARWLGPILLEAFLKWLDRRLREKAAQFDAEGHRLADTEAIPYGQLRSAHQVELLKAVRDDLWFWQVGKKRACDQCIAAVQAGVLPVGKHIG